MGVDDEYKMVSSDEANEHLLEREGPISRSSYRKRNMFASIAVGALIGAAAMFLFSLLFAPQGYSSLQQQTPTPTPTPTAAATTEAEKQVVVPTTVVKTVTAPGATQTITLPAGGSKQHIPQDGVDVKHLMPGPIILDCGSNAAEARAKDCVFDVMMQDWMPRPCHDEVLSERYLAKGNWTWWSDPEALTTLTLDEMRTGEHPVIFVVQDYHKSHCIYAWEKMVRALRNDWPLIEELVSYDHVMHCRHSTLDEGSEAAKGVRAPTAFVKCALYKDWQGHFIANSMSSIEKRWDVIDMPQR